MKKYVIAVLIILAIVSAADTLYYHMGVYIDFNPNAPVESITKVEGNKILKLGKDGEYEEFEIRGVNMGSGTPGFFSTEFKIDEETYLRWFKMIKEMGANTIRIYTVQSDTFYNAFYKFNKDNDDPLYLIHGVWVNDYVLNSHHDAFSKEFYKAFIDQCKATIDVVHGKRKLWKNELDSSGYGSYKKDISEWVIAYIWGVEWEDLTVAYSNDKYNGMEGYHGYEGEYLYTSEDASPFETMLTIVGDAVIKYESEKYHTQRNFAFSNWNTTDPFEYPENITDYFMKCASVDVEHIKTTENVVAGQFASYDVYPYYPDYLNYISDVDWAALEIGDKSLYATEDGKTNTYRAYLQTLNNHHKMPVVISEFGVSTGRGMAQEDANTDRNQGNMSEKEQGEAIIACYKDITETGSAGSCIFTWQDEWFKRTWNTMHSINLKRTAYWSDYQTNEQYFGLLSFDPGNGKSICYVDGNIAEWASSDVIASYADGSSISVKYDERFIYFMVKKDGFDLSSDKLYIPIDTTQKSGSNFCKNFGIKFDRAADFVICIDGAENSRVVVQERYEVLRANFSVEAYGYNTYFKENIPERDSPLFVPIYLLLQMDEKLDAQTMPYYETGLLKYGNANPECADFDSLSDFCAGEGCLEIKIPWQMLNFRDPSLMEIHDDYYENYGIVGGYYLDNMYVGLGSEETLSTRISLGKISLKSWGNEPTYHERLKQSYYMLKEFWSTN
jgi:hypothetical protein